MDLLANLAIGFGIALSPYTLMLAVFGCFIGTIIGALIIWYLRKDEVKSAFPESFTF